MTDTIVIIIFHNEWREGERVLLHALSAQKPCHFIFMTGLAEAPWKCWCNATFCALQKPEPDKWVWELSVLNLPALLVSWGQQWLLSDIHFWAMCSTQCVHSSVVAVLVALVTVSASCACHVFLYRDVYIFAHLDSLVKKDEDTSRLYPENKVIGSERNSVFGNQ